MQLITTMSILNKVPNVKSILETFRMYMLFLFSILFLDASSLPNIVWIISEDNSPEFISLYSSLGAVMPHLEELAHEGFVFENVASSAPVCSVSKSSYWTSRYATKISAHNHRSINKSKLPKGVKMLPEYLKAYGYYCVKNGKDDVNFIVNENSWDEVSFSASWRNRRYPQQPFFYVENIWTTHESRLHKEIDPINTLSNVDISEIPKYLRDSKVTRDTISYYKNKHKVLDKEIEKIVKKLKQDNLYEDTIIVYFSDHGGALPRTKGTFYYSGLDVPLVIRVPKKWRDEFGFKNSSRIETPVSLIDLAPTFLDIIARDIPSNMEGIPLKKDSLNKNKDRAIFASTDRFDETYLFTRSVRIGNFRYVRNYLPFQSALPYNAYRRKAPLFKSWKEDFDNGLLYEEQTHAFKAQPLEALYNLKSDPYELNNLINETSYNLIIKNLRKKLSDHLLQSIDYGFIPEPELIMAYKLGVDYSEILHNYSEIYMRAIKINDLSLSPFNLVLNDLNLALDSEHWIDRYWGLVVCSTFGHKASYLRNHIKDLYDKDNNNLVRFRAAEYLALTGDEEYQEKFETVLSKSKCKTEKLLILNSIATLKELYLLPF